MNEVITEKDYPVEWLWVFKSAFRSILGLIIIVPFFLYPLTNDIRSPGTNFNLKLYLIILIGFVPFRLVINILRRATFHYSVEDKFLTLRQGILSKQQRHVPYGVIQTLFVKQDLFDRILGLASLTIENAAQGAGSLVTPQELRIFGIRIGTMRRQQMETVGFSGNRVMVSGLTKTNAEILKGLVLQKMKENPIEDSQSGL